MCAVLYQVIGRYIFNDTPTWAESGAVLLERVGRAENQLLAPDLASFLARLEPLLA